jgi:hypothetical protein
VRPLAVRRELLLPNVVRDWAAADHLGRFQSMLGQPPEAIFIGKAMSLRAIVPG